MKRIKFSEREKLRELKAFIAICFQAMQDEGLTLFQCADRCGLCASTVYRLNEGTFTLSTHYRTIQKIGCAVGFTLNLETGRLGTTRRRLKAA